MSCIKDISCKRKKRPVFTERRANEIRWLKTVQMDIDWCKSKQQLNCTWITRFDLQNSCCFSTSIACICMLNLCSSVYSSICNGNYIAATKSKGEFQFIDFRWPAEQSIRSLAHIVKENSCNLVGYKVFLNVLYRCLVRLCPFSSVRCCDTCSYT